MKRGLIVLIFVVMLFVNPTSTSIQDGSPDNEDSIKSLGEYTTSAGPGVSVVGYPYIVLELPGESIPNRGGVWSQLLNASGLVSNVITVSQIVSNPELLNGAPLVIVDASVGSGDGTAVTQELIDILIQKDISLILTGRSAWILHRLRGTSPPSLTAPATVVLLESAEYAGAVFMTAPVPLTVGTSLTTEIGINLPVEPTQTELSRLVELTKASSSSLASLRYDSYPLDVFLFSAEDPTLLTGTGQGLLQNTIAFSSAIRETQTAIAVSNQQAAEDTLLAGGFQYMHEPTIAEAYYATYSANSLLSGTPWATWVTQNVGLIQNILETLEVDLGSETGFMTSQSDGVINCRSTAQGLWLIATLGLSGSFNIPEIVTYLSSRQVDGGFENSITSTYHVTEALQKSGNLGSINSASLETWLRSLVIDGAKTSNPDLWGAIGENPNSLSPTNDYAVKYLRSLEFIGKAHPDPAKFTEWILTRTSNGDGSFRNSQNPDEEVVTGTASALASMQILGTLSSSNRTAGLAWLSSNRLSSGGFGLKPKASDLVAKTRETSRVAGSLNELTETGGVLASGIISYISSITTEVGFETMDILPSLMWSSWILRTSRLVHASGLVDLTLATEYLNYFEKMNVYPLWDNITTISPPEYSYNQYRTMSVWTQFFGASLADSLGITLPSSIVSEVTLFLSQAQWVTGHYRPSSMSGTAHMQHSVAAVETLYLLGKLDTIPYRSLLESAILSEYSSGSWDMTGWTLKPYAGCQEAIDYLSTRAALRLGIVSSAMASEITAAIEARVQYTDLMALSYDVTTLSLLNSSAFSTDLESISRPLVLSALGSHFSSGWFNSTSLRQPVITQSVLKMVSILGLRCSLYNVHSTTIVASSTGPTAPGTNLPITVAITSPDTSHSVLVYGFGEWNLFSNVDSIDTILVPVPSNADILGPNDISIMVVDWSATRAFHSLSIIVEAGITGSLDLETPTIKIGEYVNGTLAWSLEGNVDAGQCQVTINLGSLEWNFVETSPYWFTISTTGFDAGTYPLTMTIEKTYCTQLVLSDEVVIAQPNPTYIVSPSSLDGTVGQEVSIDWSLHFASNSSQIAGQDVTLTIKDAFNTVVYSDIGVSQIGGSSFSWTPITRGIYSYSLNFAGNYSLEGSQSVGSITISEYTQITWIGTGDRFQYTQVSVEILLETISGELLVGQTVHLTITAPSTSIVYDSDLVTNSTGYVRVTVFLSENGNYLLQANYAGSGLLLGTSDSDSIIAWSTSNLQVGGIDNEVDVGASNILWAQLRDSQSSPIQGQSVSLRVILLPSTIIEEQTLTTNSTGGVYITWIANSAGAYKLEAVYDGTLSRGAASDYQDFDVLIPVTLTIIVESAAEVGSSNGIEISALNHLANPISGLSLTIEVRGPGDELLFTDSVVTSSIPITISWTPIMRGINTITVSSQQQLWYRSASNLVTEDVYETPTINIVLPTNAVAPTTEDITIIVRDTHLNSIQGATVYCLIILDGNTIQEGYHATVSDGTIHLALSLETPGILQVSVSLTPQDWLLETSTQESTTVHAATKLTITTPGLPVEQGSTVGIVITLLDYDSNPLIGSVVDIIITWTNGSVLTTKSRTTDSFGMCTIAQQFMIVGDFLINATYSGYGLNGSATDAVPQRVFVIPNIEVIHDVSCFVGDSLEIQVGYIDTLGNYILGREISISIEQNDATVFETSVSSAAGLVSIYWNPTEGGLATITILHPGGIYYLTNSTSTTTSIMEHVTGELWLTPSQVDLFESTTLVYNLTSGLRAGVNIHFEVLDMYLVPIWSSDVVTNSSGISEVVYIAIECHGILRVNAGPTLEEFLLGGDVQKTLVVMTDVLISTSLIPSPPTVGTLTNITLWLVDELGAPIDGITTTVSLFDPYGEQIQLGYFTMSISVAVVEGLAIIEFTPTMVGLYTVIVSSSGSTSVHSFVNTSYHTIYSDTQLFTSVSTHELEVGQTLVVVSRLTDHRGMPLVGRNLTLIVDGPGVNFIGPIYLVTNATGYIEWSSTLDDEGLWTLEVSFSGLGVFLPIDTTDDINVRYGTIIELSLIDTGYVVARRTSASLSILLCDTGSTPLEGFTVHYEAYHETLGLMLGGYLIQTGTEPMVLNITLDIMGDYTVIVSFAGTTHYHSSNAALELWVFGVAEVSSFLPSEVDRALSSPTPITIVDELMDPIPLTDLNVFIGLIGPTGPVNLTSHLTWNSMSVSFNSVGLPVGLYTLNVTVGWSETRVGCVSLIEFSVVSLTHVEIIDENLIGFISEPHSMTFILQDSLNETLVSATVWVSIFNPSGREIFGSPLTDRTAISSTIEGSEVSWNPTLTGAYRVVFLFEGDVYLNSTTLELVIEVRYPSSLIVNMPQLMEFGEIIPISATLSGALGRIGGATLILTVTQEGVVEREETLTTNSQGVASINLVGLLSGNHSITMSFSGSATQAASTKEMNLVITPIVVIDIEPTSNLYLGYYCTVNVTVTVLGTESEWSGTLDAWLIDPHGDEVGYWNFEIGVISTLTIGFNARLEGTHILNTTITGLPVVYSQNHSMAVKVVNEILQLQFDVGTTPIVGGFGLLAMVGIALRRKIKTILKSMPTEWSS